MIPDPEAELLLNTVETALRYAREGQLVEGHAELVYGLERAWVVAEGGEDWAVTLSTRYRIAVENYCERFGVRMG